MKFCVLFPKAENVHLIKDVGMIAYKMHKLYGYDSFLACSHNGDYPLLDIEVPGLKLDFIRKRSNNEIVNACIYLGKKSPDIDVLQLFHVTLSSVIYSLIYRMRNRKGKIFLKLDCTDELVNRIKNLKGIEKIVFAFLINNAQVIGVEQKRLYEKLKQLLGKTSNKLELIPNGIDYDGRVVYQNYNFEEKENIVLTVSRLGSKEKRIEELITIFERALDKKSSWRLVLVGPMDPEFKVFLDNYLTEKPDMIDRILVKGAIYDRKQLFEQYKKAKLYCCNSEYESFGISMLEAASMGDLIISTDVGIANELKAVLIKNDEEFIKALNELMNINELKLKSKELYDLCKDQYNWNNIVKRLDLKLKGDEFEE